MSVLVGEGVPEGRQVTPGHFRTPAAKGKPRLQEGLLPVRREFGQVVPGPAPLCAWVRTRTQTQVHTHGNTRAQSPALTHDVQEDVARCQDHLLPRGTVVDAHVALIGAIVGDADLRQPAGGTEGQHGDPRLGPEVTAPRKPTPTAQPSRVLSAAPRDPPAHARAPCWERERLPGTPPAPRPCALGSGG